MIEEYIWPVIIIFIKHISKKGSLISSVFAACKNKCLSPAK